MARLFRPATLAFGSATAGAGARDGERVEGPGQVRVGEQLEVGENRAAASPAPGHHAQDPASVNSTSKHALSGLFQHPPHPRIANQLDQRRPTHGPSEVQFLVTDEDDGQESDDLPFHHEAL